MSEEYEPIFKKADIKLYDRRKVIKEMSNAKDGEMFFIDRYTIAIIRKLGKEDLDE